ncbi:piggyBac transposable element-derived protein 3-like [Belonocnema kinseyi]|uniref:piggyBac transposable element-derived protein 3-like n=1 Tax=Belonocnema kinseyi TaxID=2817044 RepID=UPI00143CCA0B|nr:piggyBac transposable element-derived protein 3-like [Belonocnema kinseyi]
MYWKNEVDSHNDLVSKVISKYISQHIRSNLHVYDNDKLNKADRFAETRPLHELLNTRFRDFLPHEECHSVDESIVPYYRGHGAQQFIRGNPIWFGYKFWCGETISGYLAWLQPYHGANNFSEKYAEEGLGCLVVMSYADILPTDVKFKLFFGNFFTSMNLLVDLKLSDLLTTGTIRGNRISQDYPLTDADKMKKLKIGTWECATDELEKISFIL